MGFRRKTVDDCINMHDYLTPSKMPSMPYCISECA